MKRKTEERLSLILHFALMVSLVAWFATIVYTIWTVSELV